MRAGCVFVCQCGTRLHIVFEDRRESCTVPCPNPSCLARHIITGQVLEVLLEQDRILLPYDWQADDALQAPLRGDIGS